MISDDAFVPVEIVGADRDPSILLFCDHASNATPPEYGTLGLPPEDFARHIAYDVGARGVTLGLAERLNCPAVLSCFSRLLIDPNRGEDDPTLVMKLSDGSVIPGNRHADAEEVARRVARFHRPYRQAVAAAVARALDLGVAPAIFAVHSMTRQLRLRPPRPWHVTVLWAGDDRLAAPTLARLREEPDLITGENVPYHGRLEGDTMDAHAIGNGLPFSLLEIRNDLISDAAGEAYWAERLAPIIRDTVAAARSAGALTQRLRAP